MKAEREEIRMVIEVMKFLTEQDPEIGKAVENDCE